MTEQEIFDQLRPLLVNALGAAPEKIAMDRLLVSDLGAESIDLLDLSFQVEEKFGVTIEGNEMEQDARKRLSSGVYEIDGFLTEEALEEIRRSVPGLDSAKLVKGLRKADLPLLLTVAFFVHLISRKLAAKAGGVPCA
jgi:acyl carrier protein